jgi:hypothetical protein
MELSEKDLEDIKKVKVYPLLEDKSGYYYNFDFIDSGDREVGIGNCHAHLRLTTDFQMDEDELKFLKWLIFIWFRENAVGYIKDEVDMNEEDMAMEELYGGDKE